MKLYPLKFKPIFDYKIWGGSKLKTILNKDYNQDNIGESLEISDVKGKETKVLEGNLKGKTLKQLIETFKGNFVGNSVFKRFGNDFPLLIKFIDARTPLSIQVHPNDELAKKRHNSFGKNEMWYIVQGDNDANLVVGFNQEMSRESYMKHVQNSSITDVLNVVNVKKGDVFYIPTGRIHAIGAGVLLAEIQQTSDITYRIYDYNRVDAKTGLKRELHSGLAIDSIDFGFQENYKIPYKNEPNKFFKLVHTPYFKTNIIEVFGAIEKDYSNLDSFVIYMCVDGALEMQCNSSIYNIKKGETILLPAILNQIKIRTEKATILEVSM